ncbi:EnpEP protein [Cohnella sp. CIP 111063]|uniref:M1 family metallopeptidase n=1 Tax=unclassified Cohnella TaxID=2636738 RepID=UPI000B8C3EC3|nr:MULTISPECIES: M1 family metallopeptidase [unclassified Cohnella]OXS58914.1 EnpEP protein [Cohnella sp. CIP 111063]PRX72012.1 peptidase M1-like protein [Cohnella sp. SGD-V74]
MPKRRSLRMLLFVAAAAVLVMSVRFGFADAWVDQYALPASSLSDLPAAGSPAVEAKSEPNPGPDVPQKPQAVVLSNRVTEYHISVSLDENSGTLLGEQVVTWKNPGRKAVSEMYLHLYPNAFAPGSTFLRESGGKLRGDKMKEGGYGGMELTSLTTEEGETLLPRVHYVQPDDGNRNDRTLAAFRLPEPVKPGESVTLRMKFNVLLPEIFARMGKSGNFVMAGQWFPKIPVYETSGMRGRASEGWNLHQYHGDSEFYSDFGIYSVRIGVPDGYKVAATGFLTKTPAVSGGRKSFQFYADDVHDFAWSASPDFVYVEDSFSSPGIPGVRIKLYLDPLHQHLKDRYMHAAKSALAKLGQWYGEYPYSTLSVVVPPASGNGAGGMEYPTLVTGASARDDNPGYELERTLVHEIAHQYWYGLVASNEFEEAWLDEGFTSYTEDKLMASIYGVLPNLPIEASYMTHPEPLSLSSWKFSSSDGYAENVYLRGKLVLSALEKQVGDKTMSKIMRTYFQKYKFKHPSFSDFQKVVETVTKEKWTDFFRAYVQRGEMADFSVETIQTRKTDTGYESIVLLRRNGGSPESVSVWLQFQDGQSVRKRWDGVQPHVQLKLESASPLLYATIDPGNHIVLDNRKYNNYLKAEVPPEQRTRYATGITQIIEGLFGSLAW